MQDVISTYIISIIRTQTLSDLTPIRIRFFIASTDVTNTYFGVSYFSFDSTYFSTPASGNIKNSSTLNFGTPLSNYTGTVTIQISTSSDVLLIKYSYSTVFNTGYAYQIFANGLSITLSSLTTTLANFLLGYVFKNTQTDKPTAWWFEFVNQSSAVIGTRQAVNTTEFGTSFTNLLGQIQINYGKYFLLNISSTDKVASVKIYSQSSGGSPWFTQTNNIPFNIFASRTLQIYNNSIEISIKTDTDLSTYIAPTDANVIFSSDYNGNAEDLSGLNSLTYSNLTYDPVNKLFREESGIFGSGQYTTYSGFNFPSNFTCEFFVYFTSSLTSRTINLFEKTSVLKLYYTSGNINIDLNGTNIGSVAWIPTLNTWYHIWLNKSGTTFNFKVNADINTFFTLSSSTVNTNSNLLKIGDSTNPILGNCNGLNIVSGTKTYVQGQQPLLLNPYIWKFIDFNNWAYGTYTQWKKYCG